MAQRTNAKHSFINVYNHRMILIGAVSIIIVGYFWIMDETAKFRQQSHEIKQGFIDTQKKRLQKELDEVFAYIDYMKSTTKNRLKDSIKKRVYEAHTLATHIHGTYNTRMNKEDMSRLIVETLRPIRFNNGRGYFFATDFNGVERLFADKPEMEGKNVLSIMSPDNIYIVKEMIRLCRNTGEGFIRYKWTKPDKKGDHFPKYAFVKRFAPLDWLIGTGEYLDDVEQDIQKEVLARIENIRFGDNGYVFVLNYGGTPLAQGFQPQLIGKNQWEFEDVQGVKIVQEMKKAIDQPEGGFVRYLWERPGKKTPSPKLSFVKGFPEWQWMIGTGIYMDQIDEIIAKREKQLEQAIRKNILKIVTILISMLALAVLTGRWLSRKVEKNFTAFARFFKKAAKETVKIDETSLEFREFILLARSANTMVTERELARHQLQKARQDLEIKVEERTAELKEAKNYINSIVDSMPSVLVGITPEERVVLWNLQAEKATGIKTETATGKNLGDVFPLLGEERDKIRKTLMESTPRKESKLQLELKNQTRFVDITIYPVATNGSQGAVIRMDDITDQVRMEEMMIQSEKMLSVGGLAAGMAHEINNPLAGMIQTASVMENRLTSDTMPANLAAAEKAGTSMEAIRTFMEKREIPRMITAIKESGARVAEIVSNMLSFARKGDTHRSPQDMSELMDKTLELASTDYDLKRKYDFRQIEIVKEYRENLPKVLCQGSKLQQVLLNLLTNGAQAMQETKNKESGERQRFVLRLSYEEENKMVRIEIEDNGPGMVDATRKRVFEPFFTTKPEGLGTGLGLSVSYFIITEDHGGTMTVESQPGKGTTFIIRLPLNWGQA
ncbi:MAG: PAS domain S-box protein [Desulfobacteraceae bacterium]|nr:PAS domain S-box protein [Desulfobacteraceae bacterium]